MDKEVVYWKGIRAIIGLIFQIPDKNTIYLLDLGKNKLADIHTFFCLRDIDIVLISENLEIVGCYLRVKPFRVIFPKRKFRFIVEGVDISKKDVNTVISFIKKNIYLHKV
ncbi:MAG TPA: hypothetical protein EYH09_01480 [Candidatus Nanopusillus sp.]|nr:hypothetical protein [Candidatus Nanopusillus sp.]HIP90450.1 hypothetical protein [Candidatus Nanopusillus sp.]